MRTEEIWHDLDRFPSHQVSSHGRVRNKRTCLSRVLTGARKGQRIHGYHVEYM